MHKKVRGGIQINQRRGIRKDGKKELEEGEWAKGKERRGQKKGERKGGGRGEGNSKERRGQKKETENEEEEEEKARKR